MRQEQREFRDRFHELFDAHFYRILRYLDRITGEPDLAADLAQETFVRLYRRGAVPDAPEAWLISVAMNLFRNASAMQARRGRLLAGRSARRWQADPPASPARSLEAGQTRRRVRAALDQLPERERNLLLLRAEGYSYRELGAALELNEASVGTLLARAREQFRETYAEAESSDD
ncbi:MAG: sigma-70 family RNA polymerase sigma factor [Longimicrobiales bacterium]